MFFLSPDDDCLPAVLHTRTRGEWRAGPSAAGGHWYRRPGTFDEPSWRPNPPRWPVDVRIETGDGEEGDAEPTERPPDPFDPLEFDLARPELHPFDAESMRAALDVMRERVATAVGARAARDAAVAAGKRQPPGEADLLLLEQVHAGRLAAQRALDAVTVDFEARVASGTFTAADVPRLVQALAAIPLPSVEAHDRTEFLATGQQFREGPNAPLTRPYEPYGGGKGALLKPWYDLGRYAATTEPDRVPPPARGLLQQKFAFDARAETAGIGHAPDDRRVGRAVHVRQPGRRHRLSEQERQHPQSIVVPEHSNDPARQRPTSSPGPPSRAAPSAPESAPSTVRGSSGSAPRCA